MPRADGTFVGIRVPAEAWERVFSQAARFWPKVEKTDDCWLWTAALTPAGYGKFGAGGKYGRTLLAHRWAYEQANGPIPSGHQLHHLCDVGRCVNPDHLVAVTPKGHRALDGCPGAATMQRAKTHCPRGHEYDEQNTRVNAAGARLCRACERARSLRRGRRRSQPPRPPLL